MYELKHNAKQKLKIVRSTGDKNDRKAYYEAKREFKRTKKNVKIQSEKDEAESLARNLCNSKNFWNDVSNICGKERKDDDQDNITLLDWKEHFENIFSDTNQDDVLPYPNIDMTCNVEHELNKNITYSEVVDAIRNLNNGKSSGTDRILPEMLKKGGQPVVNYLLQLYNVIYNSRRFPLEWSKSIVVPIHKKGRKDIPDNYRGISLINIMCKGYTSILNQRLYKWIEKNNVLCEEQAGFRKQYSTVDHIFTLHAVVQKCLRKAGQKVYEHSLI